MIGLDRELFQSSGYTPELDVIAWQQLPPIVRVLLTTDGTVTKSLEAYCWEPVTVRRNKQAELPQGGGSKVMPPSEPVWQRDVNLIGQRSGRCYAEACSLVRFQLLPEPLKAALEQDRLGIGGVIRELGLETYRRIVAVGQQPPLPVASQRLPEPQVKPQKVWRTYHLYYHQQVLMEITETFDLAVF